VTHYGFSVAAHTWSYFWWNVDHALLVPMLLGTAPIHIIVSALRPTATPISAPALSAAPAPTQFLLMHLPTAVCLQPLASSSPRGLQTRARYELREATRGATFGATGAAAHAHLAPILHLAAQLRLLAPVTGVSPSASRVAQLSERPGASALTSAGVLTRNLA
jgi:hypothetical protein